MDTPSTPAEKMQASLDELLSAAESTERAERARWERAREAHPPTSTPDNEQHPHHP